MNNLYHQFEILVKEIESTNFKKNRDNFFELIHVVDGTGTQTVNKLKFNYRKNNLFLLTPQDTYNFEVDTKTTFFSIKFDQTIAKNNSIKETTQQIEYILQNASHR